MSDSYVTRRRVLQMLGMGAAASLVAACSSTTPSAPAPTSGPAAAQKQAPAQSGSGGVTTLSMLMSVGGSGKALTGGLQQFNDRFKGQYEVKSDQIAIESLLDNVMTQFISGTPTYDIMSISSDWMAGVGQFLEPLDEYLAKSQVDFAKTFGPKVRNAVSYEDKVVGLPARFGADIMFYRKDLFDQAGLKLPSSHQEFRDLAQKLMVKDASGAVSRFGTSFKAQSPSWTVGSFGHFFFGAGGRFITPDGKSPHPSLNSPFAQELLDTIRAIIDDGSTPEVAAWTYDDNVVAFQQGKVAMSDEYSARALLVEDKQKSQVVGKMGYAPFVMQKLGPEEPTHYGSTWNLSLDKNSKNKEAAWQLATFLTSAETQKYMALNFSNGPTVIELYSDPEYVKLDPAAGAAKQVLEGTGWLPYYPVPQTAELEKAAHEEIQSFYLKRQSSKQALDNISRRFGEILKA